MKSKCPKMGMRFQRTIVKYRDFVARPITIIISKHLNTTVLQLSEMWKTQRSY